MTFTKGVISLQRALPGPRLSAATQEARHRGLQAGLGRGPWPVAFSWPLTSTYRSHPPALWVQNEEVGKGSLR